MNKAGYVLAGAIVLAATPALADAIDGHWCFPDGRRISIDGPSIVTPGGVHIQGDYARHYFTFVVPQPEPGAGEKIAMTLVNEMTVHLRHGEGHAYTVEPGVEVWRRCGPPVSLRRRAHNRETT